MMCIMSGYVYISTCGMYLGMDTGQLIEEADIEVEYGT